MKLTYKDMQQIQDGLAQLSILGEDKKNKLSFEEVLYPVMRWIAHTKEFIEFYKKSLQKIQKRYGQEVYYKESVLNPSQTIANYDKDGKEKLVPSGRYVIADNDVEEYLKEIESLERKEETVLGKKIPLLKIKDLLSAKMLASLTPILEIDIEIEEE